jgi:hypothetical protein
MSDDERGAVVDYINIFSKDTGGFAEDVPGVNIEKEERGGGGGHNQKKALKKFLK